MVDLMPIEWPLRSEHVELRPLTPADAVDVQAYRGLPEVTTHLPHPPLSLTETMQRLGAWDQEPDRLAIAVRRRGRPDVVGDVELMLRRSPALAPAVTREWEASLGYALHPCAQGEGLATEAVRAVLVLAFSVLGLRRVSARAFTGAAASSRLLARVGLHQEGIERAVVLGRDGHWLDDELWAVHAAQWPGTGPPAP